MCASVQVCKCASARVWNRTHSDSSIYTLLQPVSARNRPVWRLAATEDGSFRFEPLAPPTHAVAAQLPGAYARSPGTQPTELSGVKRTTAFWLGSFRRKHGQQNQYPSSPRAFLCNALRVGRWPLDITESHAEKTPVCGRLNTVGSFIVQKRIHLLLLHTCRPLRRLHAGFARYPSGVTHACTVAVPELLVEREARAS